MVTYALTETVAGNVRGLMLAAGENPTSLARNTGIPRVTLLRRLNGQVPFSVDELEAVGRYLGVNPSAFFIRNAA